MGENGFGTGTVLLGARYAFNNALWLSGQLGYRMRNENGDDVHIAQQILTGSFNPSPIPLRKFEYIFYASASGQNEFVSTGGTIQNFTGNIGHSLNRKYEFGARKHWLFAFDLAQYLDGIVDSTREDQADITHRIALSLSRRSGRMITQARTWAFDRRRIAGPDFWNQALNFTLSNTHQLTRYSNWSLSTTISAIRSGDDVSERSEGSPFIGLDLEYRHIRLFGIRRLLYRSTLRFDTAAADDFKLGEGGNRLSWENRLDYTIGLIQMELRIVNLNPGSRGIHNFFFMITRRF
jgi:hypothetical protein